MGKPLKGSSGEEEGKQTGQGIKDVAALKKTEDKRGIIKGRHRKRRTKPLSRHH